MPANTLDTAMGVALSRKLGSGIVPDPGKIVRIPAAHHTGTASSRRERPTAIVTETQ